MKETWKRVRQAIAWLAKREELPSAEPLPARPRFPQLTWLLQREELPPEDAEGEPDYRGKGFTRWLFERESLDRSPEEAGSNGKRKGGTHSGFTRWLFAAETLHEADKEKNTQLTR